MGWSSGNDPQNDTTELLAWQASCSLSTLPRNVGNEKALWGLAASRACCFSWDPGIRKMLMLLPQLPVDTHEASVKRCKTAKETHWPYNHLCQ